MNALSQEKAGHNEAVISTVRASYKQCTLSLCRSTLSPAVTKQIGMGMQVVRIKSLKKINSGPRISGCLTHNCCRRQILNICHEDLKENQ